MDKELLEYIERIVRLSQPSHSGNVILPAALITEGKRIIAEAKKKERA